MTQASGPFFRVLKQVMEIQETTANPKDPPVNWVLQYPETCGSLEIPLSLASPRSPLRSLIFVNLRTLGLTDFLI